MTRIAPALVLLVAVLLGCGQAPTTGGPSAGPVDASIAADDNAFDRTTLAVPAGRAFSLGFENREGAPHNVAILDAGGAVLFSGEVFGGPATMRYEVPAIPAGTYTFRCDVHPEMAGELGAA
jgi:plastocyanin